ncbi:thiamine-phosphate kinase [Neptunomonas antarctica]|uniref:Thiamine-monophosphate kinase n=1 Tax=Neptunomonas antarctica TaxID=619304 RepID=A0A1N7J3W8_9GAMM|nr:thiamine-phosphate kinase [Neptunomonas antarctica]SIS44004.1 thiamine-phosphate kinase [Neptunomonas antarctica]
MDEFALIRRYFQSLQQDGLPSSVSVGIGDDCAVLNVPPDQQLVVSIDTLVEGVHFLPDTPADQLAWRILGAAVSDLAAMGATPAWLTLALTLPQAEESWISAFSAALSAATRQYNIQLVGGDTTRGPLTLTAQVHGFVKTGTALLRKGAKPGDLICVTGTLGDSRAGLDTLLNDASLDEDVAYLRRRFYRPEPRIETGQLISPFASSCIDISDGLLGDINHILEQSGVGAQINPAALPLSAELLRFAGQKKARSWALTGGEDFELCFTVPPSQWISLQSQLQHHDVQVTPVGAICEATGIQLFIECEWQMVEASGYKHF